jgi:TonB family protein
MFSPAKRATLFVAAAFWASVGAQPVVSQKPPVVGPRLIKLVKPDCSKGHDCHGKHGVVVVTVGVLTDGTVGDADIKSGDGQLADDALKAAKQCRFAPGTFNGKPTSMNFDLEYRF